MKRRSGHNTMNHTTGQVPAFSKICAVFGFLLIMLAVIAVPCGATNAANNSDNPVVTNQTTSPTTAATTEVTTSPTTEVTTSVTTTGPTEVTTSPTDQPTTVVTTSPATQATTTATPTDQPEIPAEVPLLSATKDVVTVQYSGVSGGNIWTHEEVGNIYPWVPGTESPGQVSGKITSRPFSLAVGSDAPKMLYANHSCMLLLYARS